MCVCVCVCVRARVHGSVCCDPFICMRVRVSIDRRSTWWRMIFIASERMSLLGADIIIDQLQHPFILRHCDTVSESTASPLTAVKNASISYANDWLR